jgi:hypothetical protein
VRFGPPSITFSADWSKSATRFIEPGKGNDIDASSIVFGREWGCWFIGMTSWNTVYKYGRREDVGMM